MPELVAAVELILEATVPAGNAATQLTLDYGSTAIGGGPAADVSTITMSILNKTDQAITGLVAKFYGTLGGASIEIDYTVPSVDVAGSGGTGSFTVPVDSGIRPRLKLVATFAAAPSGGGTWHVSSMLSPVGGGAGSANLTNIVKWGGTTQTGADLTPLLQGAATKQGALTDHSGTIAAANTSQQVMAANAARRYLLVQNLDTSEDLWIDFTADAVESEPSLKIAPGQSFVQESGFVSTEAVNVIAATVGHAFAVKSG